MTICRKCYRPFTPVPIPDGHFLLTRATPSMLERYYTTCSGCKLLGLAAFMEDSEPGDSIADISAGEQIGAQIREIVGRE